MLSSDKGRPHDFIQKHENYAYGKVKDLIYWIVLLMIRHLKMFLYIETFLAGSRPVNNMFDYKNENIY